jgi:hypothetical protein
MTMVSEKQAPEGRQRRAWLVGVRFLGVGLIACLTMGTGVATASDDPIRGSGLHAKVQRHVQPFHALQIEGAFDVVVICGRPQSVEISGDDNLVPHIITRVEGARLRVYPDTSISPRNPLKVLIGAHGIDSVSSSGVSTVSISKISGQRFEAEIVGAGDVRLSGRIESCNITLAGGAELHAQDLAAGIVDMRIDGAGEAEVHASQSLQATITGLGEVIYHGNPKKILKNITGLGTVTAFSRP